MLNLPKTVTIHKNDVENEDEIADFLSDKYGFCINTLYIKYKGDKIIVSKIDWDTSD